MKLRKTPPFLVALLLGALPRPLAAQDTRVDAIAGSAEDVSSRVACHQNPPSVSAVRDLGGYIGQRIRANTEGYLKQFDIERYAIPLLAAEAGTPTPRSPRPATYRIVEQNHRFIILDGADVLVGRLLPFRHEAIRADDAIKAHGTNLFRWLRTFSLKSGQAKQRVRLTLDFEAAHTGRFALIPGISWNGNRDDPGNVYHGFSHEGTPWSFAWHRTLIPGATYSEGERHTVGLFAEVLDPRVGLSCSLLPGETTTIHRLIVPEEELPKRVLIRERGLSPGRANTLELNPGEALTVTAWVVLHPRERPRLGYRYLLDAAWTHCDKATAARHTTDDLWRMGLRFARESLWDDRAKMFHLALQCDDQRRWVQAGGFAIGWCGRNGDLANALLAEFLHSGDRASLSMALDCLDTWARRAIADTVVTNVGEVVSASAIRPFVGTWTVTYNNGAVAHLSFLGDGCLWGGALDTRSIDKETVLPLLAGAVRLFELTDDSAYLVRSEDAAYYFAAWQIAQTLPNPPGSLMDAIGYDTFGGTSVATVHMCADPFGVSAIPHLLKLARHTGRDIWNQRAVALWNNASQGISTGTLVLQGLPPRPCGSQDETVNYTDWGYDYLAQGMDRQAPRGAGQCWLTAWPTAMRLTLLSDPDLRRRIETWAVQPLVQFHK